MSAPILELPVKIRLHLYTYLLLPLSSSENIRLLHNICRNIRSELDNEICRLVVISAHKPCGAELYSSEVRNLNHKLETYFNIPLSESTAPDTSKYLDVRKSLIYRLLDDTRMCIHRARDTCARSTRE